jgi:hypothetical protein
MVQCNHDVVAQPTLLCAYAGTASFELSRGVSASAANTRAVDARLCLLAGLHHRHRAELSDCLDTVVSGFFFLLVRMRRQSLVGSGSPLNSVSVV